MVNYTNYENIRSDKCTYNIPDICHRKKEGLGVGVGLLDMEKQKAIHINIIISK